MAASTNITLSLKVVDGGNRCNGNDFIRMSADASHPAEHLKALAEEHHLELTDPQLAHILDERDELKHFRDLFHVPTLGELLDGEVDDGVCRVCARVRAYVTVSLSSSRCSYDIMSLRKCV